MALVIDGKLAADPFVRIAEGDAVPDNGAVLVTLATWTAQADTLARRSDPVGVLLGSDESPEVLAEAVNKLQLIALDFPTFRDGRAYSYARLLRERYGYTGELRAVGDVQLEQLHYMERTGFNAFEIDSDDPIRDLKIANRDFTTWYQPSGDRRDAAAKLRAGVRPAPDPSQDPSQGPSQDPSQDQEA